LAYLTSPSPSIVPEDTDRDVYIVLDDFGRLGRAWRVTDDTQADRGTLMRHLLEGQFWMNKSLACFAALSVFAALLLSSTHAQQQSSIILSCNGTSKLTPITAADVKPDSITNLGITVNLADRTVTFMDYVAPVTLISTTLVSFSGRQTSVVFGVKKPFIIDGSIDPVTGYTSIDWMYEDIGNNASWELTCRPATRPS
jgi:hypothetical protein